MLSTAPEAVETRSPLRASTFRRYTRLGEKEELFRQADRFIRVIAFDSTGKHVFRREVDDSAGLAPARIRQFNSRDLEESGSPGRRDRLIRQASG